MQIVDHHSPSPTVARLSAHPVLGIKKARWQVKSSSKVCLGVAVHERYSRFSYAFSPFVSGAMKPQLFWSEVKPIIVLDKGAFLHRVLCWCKLQLNIQRVQKMMSSNHLSGGLFTINFCLCCTGLWENSSQKASLSKLFRSTWFPSFSSVLQRLQDLIVHTFVKDLAQEFLNSGMWSISSLTFCTTQ